MLLRISGIQEHKTLQFKKYIKYFEKGTNINPLCNIELSASGISIKVDKSYIEGVKSESVIISFSSLGGKDMFILRSSDFYKIELV